MTKTTKVSDNWYLWITPFLPYTRINHSLFFYKTKPNRMRTFMWIMSLVLIITRLNMRFISMFSLFGVTSGHSVADNSTGTKEGKKLGDKNASNPLLDLSVGCEFNYILVIVRAFNFLGPGFVFCIICSARN